jgi:hypothetical protein
MREIRLPKALIEVCSDRVRTIFEDGAVSEFVPPTHDPEFVRVSRWAGYGDPLIHGIEHDVTHSWLAYQMGLGVSGVVWADAHGGTDAERCRESILGIGFPDRLDDEEHRCLRLQRYINQGSPDEFGVLDSTFGAELPSVARELLLVLRPWLA